MVQLHPSTTFAPLVTDFMFVIVVWLHIPCAAGMKLNQRSTHCDRAPCATATYWCSASARGVHLYVSVCVCMCVFRTFACHNCERFIVIDNDLFILWYSLRNSQIPCCIRNDLIPNLYICIPFCLLHFIYLF